MGGKGELFCSSWSDFGRGVRSLMLACPTSLVSKREALRTLTLSKKTEGLNLRNEM